MTNLDRSPQWRVWVKISLILYLFCHCASSSSCGLFISLPTFAMRTFVLFLRDEILVVWYIHIERKVFLFKIVFRFNFLKGFYFLNCIVQKTQISSILKLNITLTYRSSRWTVLALFYFIFWGQIFEKLFITCAPKKKL